MIIHDDLMIDCPGYLVEKIVDIKCVQIPGYQQQFPIDLNIIN